MNTSTSAAYERLFQSFGLTENPFRLSPDPRFLFLGSAYQKAISELAFGMEMRRGLMVLTGEPGTGKTLVVRQLLQWLHSRKISTAYIFHSHLNATALLEFIATDFGLKVESSRRSEFVAALTKWLEVRQLEGDSPVVVVDEAQALSPRALSELCLLLNLENARGKLLQIVLAGQPELDETLRRPELRHLRQQVAVRCRLPVLSLEETEEYIAARLSSAGGGDARIFSAETVRALHGYAQGVPRVINLLCEKALRAAYADRQPAISAVYVQRAASEMDLVTRPDAPWESMAESNPMAVLGGTSDAVTRNAPLPARATPAFQSFDPAITLDERPTKPIVVPFPAVATRVSSSHEPAPRSTGVAFVKASVDAVKKSAFLHYWGEVAQSFAQDWRHFVAGFRKAPKVVPKIVESQELPRAAQRD